LKRKEKARLRKIKVLFVAGFGPISRSNQAAQSCFGTEKWPADISILQAWIEFDVEDVGETTRELQKRGYKLLVSAREEPWKQVVTRLIGPEGLLVGITKTPWMRK